MRISPLHYGTSVPPSFLFLPVRTRLLHQLETEPVSQQKVVSIVAPVGYGKTILMTQLHAQRQQSGQRCFWVGLGHRDVTAARIVQLLKAAMSTPQAEDHPTQVLFNGDTPLDHLIDELIETVSGQPGPTTIFIDNLNSCADDALGNVLDALIFRTPAEVRFIWSSTTVPAVNTGRAKLEGLIRQIGFDDLNFNASEARELLGDAVTDSIGSAGTEAILRRTEGWPAGVRMAQIALASSNRPMSVLAAFSGSDEDVSAMLNRQVLDGFSSELRSFLLSVALLNTFSIDLCRHLFGTTPALQHLDLLVNRNVFIIPLDRNRRRYRFHGLFREYLLGEAARQLAPKQQRDVFKRTAAWCEESEEWEDAIGYALQAGEHEQASRILDRTATLFVRDRGDIQQYIHWMERLMPTGVRIGWEAHFWYIWALVFHRRFCHGLKQQELLAERVRNHKGKDDAPPDDLVHRLDHIRLCIELFTDHVDAAHEGADRWLATVKKCDLYNFGSVSCIKAICLTAKFRFADARQAMRLTESIFSEELGGAYAVGWVALINGVMSCYEGNYPVAHRTLTAGLAAARETLGDDAVLCGMLAFAAAKCAVEMGKDAEARDAFLSGLRTAHIHGLVDTTSYGLETAVKLWDGTSNGTICTDQLHGIAGRYPPRLSLMLSCYLVQRLLHLGRVDEALAEAERIDLIPDAGKADIHAEYLDIPCYRDLHAATSLAVLVARRQFKQADARILQESRSAQHDGRYARMVELCLASMSIAMQAGNPSAAARSLSRAVSTAAWRGIWRPFMDRTVLVAELVNDTKSSDWVFTRGEERKFFAEICARLPISPPLQHDLLGGWARKSGFDMSPTRKEAELLSLLDLGLSNQQIADHTNVSITTIKWHLKNLYRKFDVPNRSAALARARSMKLLSQ